MSDIVLVYPDMFEEVYDPLLRALDPSRPKEEFRRLFHPGWTSPEEHVGCALTHAGRIVAFIGLLYSLVEVGQNTEKLCNITSWVAEERFRRDSIVLLLPLRSPRDVTVTNMSPDPQVRAIFLRLGYRFLEEYTTIMRPPLSTSAIGRPAAIRLTTDPESIAARLDASLARIHTDHATFAFPLLVESDAGHCYCLYTIRRRRRIRTALFHSISHPDLFVKALPTVRRHLLSRHRALIAECDARWMAGVDVPASFEIRREVPRLFRSPSLPSGSVPNLYSEVVLLNLG